MPASPEDTIAIANLVGHMAYLTDFGTVEDYLAVFADDATMQFPGQPVIEGLAAIAPALQAGLDSGMVGPGSGTRHVVSTIAVDVDGDTATSQATWQFYDAKEAPTLQAMGRYQDAFRRTAEGWRCTHRGMHIP